MKPQWDNLVTSSFLLYLDHILLSRGQAFTNVESKLYPVQNTFNGYYQYNFPFAQLVNDFSINGAIIPTGLYLNSVFCPVGTSGLVGINFERGSAYFSTGLISSIQVSGRYSIKDLNITLPNSPDLKVLFENKLNVRDKAGKIANSYTGMGNDELSYPAIFCRSTNSESEPYAFGGLKDIKNNIGSYIFTDSLFLLNATTSLLRDLKHEYVALLDTGEFPFNNLGYFKNNIPYNYTGITVGKVANGSGILINNVNITDFTKRGLFSEAQSLTTDCYFGVSEFELSKPRLT